MRVGLHSCCGWGGSSRCTPNRLDRRRSGRCWLRARQLLGRLLDVELSLRGILRGFGLKVGQVTRKTFEARIRELVTGQATLERIAEAMLSARATLKAEYEKLHKAVLAIVREDAVCRRLMTVPGVGPVVAVTFKSAVDDPSRIAKSKAVGALFGLTPKKYQSVKKMSPVESRELAMRWCARHFMKLPMFCCRG